MSTLASWSHCPRCGASLLHRDGRVECSACGFVHYANPVPAVSALVVDREGRVLLARRAFEPAAGLWDALGGFLNEGEEPLEGLRRELLEETGSEADIGDFVGVFPDRYGDAPDAAHVLNLAWEARIVRGELVPADDVSELRWFSLDALPSAEELAFGWLAVCLRRWSRARGAPAKTRGPANRPSG